MSRVLERRSRQRLVDGTWHIDPVQISFGIHRIPAGAPTSAARTLLDKEVLPELAAWLGSPDGRDLLREGAAYNFAERLHSTNAAKEVLTAALDRINRMQRQIELNVAPSTADNALLGHVNKDLTRLLGHVGGPISRTDDASPPAARPIEPPPAPGL
jgi:hypothetical protein